MKNRIISLVLALTLLFGLVSCTKAEDVPPKDRNLTVETEAVVYTAAGIDAVSSRLADLLIRIAPRLGYPTLGDSEKGSIVAMIRSDIIPIAQNIPIYEGELFDLVTSAEEYLDAYETDCDVDLEFILGLYTRFTASIDADRLGRFTYRLELQRLAAKLDDAIENYEKNGYGIEIVEHYTALLEDARALGEGRYADAFGATVFLFATSLGLGDIQGGALSLSPSDALVVIQMQGERLTDLGLTDSEWHTVAAMCEEHVPTGGGTLEGKMLLSLKNDGFFAAVSSLMPDAVELYATLSRGISKESVDLMASDDRLAYMRAVLGEMIENEDELRAFLDRVIAELPAPERFTLSGINAYDKAGYEAFLERPIADADALILSVKAFLDTPTDVTYAALEDVASAFIASKNPVVAYVFFYL